MIHSLPTIYVVSLARASERRARMIHRLSSEDLSYAIVEAYEGTDPAVAARASGATLDIDLRIVACFVSHLRALEQFVATNAAEAIICEDDVRPLRGFAQRFLALRENVPDDTPLVALGYFVWRWDGFVWSGKDKSKENLTTIGADLWGTQMYLVRRAWAIECLDRFGVPVDQIATDQVKTSELITRDSRFRGGLVSYPPLALEDLTGSILNPAAGVANHPGGQSRWDSSLYVP
jgi:GR25 family glycosyltransferase involved in LPS biosynthesis